MSWTEAVVDHVEETVPARVQAGLRELRQHDKQAHGKTVALAKEEAALLDELKLLIKEGSSKYNERALQARADALVARRQDLSNLLDEQQKRAAAVYNLLDEKISNLDANTRSISHLLHEASREAGEAERKKRRKGNGKDDDADAVRDVNEPTYCMCNQVSYGTMIGCDNEECPIEWFHLACVGLTEPIDPWFCPTCSGEEAPTAVASGGGDGADTESERGSPMRSTAGANAGGDAGVETESDEGS